MKIVPPAISIGFHLAALRRMRTATATLVGSIKLALHIVLLIVTFLCLFHARYSYAESTPIGMKISFTPEKIDPNEDCFIDIKLENISSKPFSMGHYKTLIAETKPYNIYVTDQFGKSIPYRKDLRHPEQMLGFNEVALVTLQPGEFFVDRVVLDDLFDLSKPGRYTVEIDRKLLREWGGWELHSNRIIITIPG